MIQIYKKLFKTILIRVYKITNVLISLGLINIRLIVLNKNNTFIYIFLQNYLHK